MNVVNAVTFSKSLLDMVQPVLKSIFSSIKVYV